MHRLQLQRCIQSKLKLTTTPKKEVSIINANRGDYEINEGNGNSNARLSILTEISFPIFVQTTQFGRRSIIKKMGKHTSATI